MSCWGPQAVFCTAFGCILHLHVKCHPLQPDEYLGYICNLPLNSQDNLRAVTLQSSLHLPHMGDTLAPSSLPAAQGTPAVPSRRQQQ